MVVISEKVTPDNIVNGCKALSYSADAYENDPGVEYLWAESAYEYAEVHYNLLCSVDTKFLNLTPIDDEIYSCFKEYFPDFELSVINEDYLKSSEQKEAWRNFCEMFKTKLKNYNFGTLLRLRCDGDYSPDNTTIAPRIQFYAIEIARNKEGVNDAVRKRNKTENKK